MKVAEFWIAGELIRILQLIRCGMQTNKKAVSKFTIVIVGIVLLYPLQLLTKPAETREKKNEYRYDFVPLYMELIPKVSGLHWVSLNPTWRSIRRKSSPSGKASTDSGR